MRTAFESGPTFQVRRRSVTNLGEMAWSRRQAFGFFTDRKKENFTVLNDGDLTGIPPA